jgi:DNA invertase Pin-like site-specific DNA recombinase
MSDLICTQTESRLQKSSGISSKITSEHLQLQAALYIRQSTGAQLREHQESTARQYALRDRLTGLGWAQNQIVVIDEDLGLSGSGTADRVGFRRLLKLITDQQIGMVIGLEMSRLARNSKDWSDLFEVCAIFQTLIADEDGVFNPVDPNDRLVLGLKGIIAELELHTMKVRLERGRMNKASRGELFHDVPVGYMLDSRGLPVLDPDESAQHVMKLFFELFQTLRSANGLFHYLSEHNIRLPFRENRRDGSCSIDWRLPSKSTVYGLLKHPLYAGAFGYRRLCKYSKKTQGKQGKKYLPPDQWKVLIKNLHPAYISWEDYEGIQQQLSENDNVGDRRGIPREGSALLAGIVRCSHCGRRLSPSYPSSFQPIYRCGRHRTIAGVSPCCSSIRCTTLDDFVESRILEAIAPAGVELSLRVIEDEESRRTQLDTLYAHRVEQARFRVESSERHYRHVDPANRLVAARLEKEWEASLAELESASQQLSQFRNATPVQLSKSERDRLHQACADMTVIWRSEASLVERKQIARLLLQRVDVDVQNNSEQVHVTLHWSGGFESVHKIARAVRKFDQLDGYQNLIDRALELTLSGCSAPQAAETLQREGYRCPRKMKAISASTVTRLLLQNPMACKQLNAPDLLPDHWLADDLARRLCMPTKRLKDWVTRGWAIAAQRPHGRVWIIIADEQEVERLQALARRQEGQGRPLPPEELRIPLSNSREK